MFFNCVPKQSKASSLFYDYGECSRVSGLTRRHIFHHQNSICVLKEILAKYEKICKHLTTILPLTTFYPAIIDECMEGHFFIVCGMQLGVGSWAAEQSGTHIHFVGFRYAVC